MQPSGGHSYDYIVQQRQSQIAQLFQQHPHCHEASLDKSQFEVQVMLHNGAANIKIILPPDFPKFPASTLAAVVQESISALQGSGSPSHHSGPHTQNHYPPFGGPQSGYPRASPYPSGATSQWGTTQPGASAGLPARGGGADVGNDKVSRLLNDMSNGQLFELVTNNDKFQQFAQKVLAEEQSAKVNADTRASIERIAQSTVQLSQNIQEARNQINVVRSTEFGEGQQLFNRKREEVQRIQSKFSIDALTHRMHELVTEASLAADDLRASQENAPNSSELNSFINMYIEQRTLAITRDLKAQAAASALIQQQQQQQPQQQQQGMGQPPGMARRQMGAPAPAPPPPGFLQGPRGGRGGYAAPPQTGPAVYPVVSAMPKR